ncbi:integrase [Nocardia neocaledoniensis NBRC 108232]|uniref:Site-specific recombinase XerD n=1 Tax=Nocardia neocaledoniensis TaxID=236511 RepID=A0A317NGR9_9NOCA|nr:tyrosine-type recombinase/integrase [Nocardia neocaledoniensis]PWV74389.1 site-specific recombinase XerD [Nocardia neocaledoniensis]GEM29116.1 integrase [Nocardia neocaledoniensis NBRC 108232]
MSELNELRGALRQGRIELPAVGCVERVESAVPYGVVVDGIEVEPISSYLSSLVISDVSPLTVRSYAHDLLRWWRVLAVLGVWWERATREDVEVMVGWMRSATNPQRRRSPMSISEPGSVNLKTGKPVLSPGYAPATINHALTVVYGFYEHHLFYGRGPLVNPVPPSSDRRRIQLSSPLDPRTRLRRAPMRQKQPQRAPRSIPDAAWMALFAAMTHDRDRALLEFAVSSGARASELLGICGEHVEWGYRRIWVVSKGTRELAVVPASPEAFDLLARYFERSGTPRPKEQVWRTLRGQPRPLTYWALRRVLQRANDELGTNWSFHDIRHTAATRMAKDPQLTLPEVQAILRHRHLSTTETYLLPRIEELHDKMQEHYSRPRPATTFATGYSAEDIATVFGE